MDLNIDFSKISESETEHKKSPLELNLESELSSEDNSSKSPLELSLKENEPVAKANSLALNLEEVALQEEQSEIIKSFEIEESSIDRIIAAIGAGLAVESVINARILNKFNSISESDEFINEARALLKTVVRKGELTRKTICPEGFRVVNGNCQRMSSKDAIAFSRRAKKAAKTRARRRPSGASMKMRNRSILVRKRNESKVNRITSK